MKISNKQQNIIKDLQSYLEEEFVYDGYKILIWNSDPLNNSKIVFIWHLSLL